MGNVKNEEGAHPEDGVCRKQVAGVWLGAVMDPGGLSSEVIGFEKVAAQPHYKGPIPSGQIVTVMVYISLRKRIHFSH